MENKKPNAKVVKSLMVRTFSERRRKILSGGQLVLEVCTEYPFLKKAMFVSREMDCIVQKDNTYEEFLISWRQYSTAIISFAESHKSNRELRRCFRDNEDDPDSDRSLTALRCLGYFLGGKQKKKASCSSNSSTNSRRNPFIDIPALLIEPPRGTPPAEAIDGETTQPLIVQFTDADKDIAPQIFIAVEGDLLIECANLPAAIYTMLAAHYIFDIQYNAKVSDILLFLQEKILGLHDPQAKKSSVYLSVIAGIVCYIDPDEDSGDTLILSQEQ